MTRPTGSSKDGTTRKNIQRYYTPEHLIRYMNRTFDLLKPIIDIISEIKHGVDAANGKGETFAVCLGCLRFRVKIFVFEVNVRSHFSIFL